MTTIEEIEGVSWPEPGPEATFLIQRCTQLRRKPLSQFTTEDLRLMIGQQIALPILLPNAVDLLLADPLAEGDYYPGDLLLNVVRLPRSVWSTLPREQERLIQFLHQTQLPTNVDDNVRHAVAGFLASR